MRSGTAWRTALDPDFRKSWNEKDEDGKPTGRGTALKPAWEPIVLAQKPREGTYAANAAKHGTGYLNIDAARVPLAAGDELHVDTDWGSVERKGESWGMRKTTGRKVVRGGEKVWKGPKGDRGGEVMRLGVKEIEREGSPLGRWPANLVHDGSPEVVAEFPHTVNPFGKTGIANKSPNGRSPMFGVDKRTEGTRIGDMGSAARYFYCAKPSTKERELGLHGFPEDLKPTIKRKVEGNLTMNGSTCGYNGGGTTPRANIHPTCKPLAVMRWLIRLLVPVNGTLIDPFLGSGTTLCAAALEYRNAIGIEKEPEYARIARARVEYWENEALEAMLK